jgi:hypothetical protein
MGRTGSTLLRFLLDAHPDLACPPETSLPAMCGQLAVVWSLIEGAVLSQNRGDTPSLVPPGAVAGIKATVDRMTGAYLDRRNKKRFCDKSLGSARYVDLLAQLYPKAKFLCLYRSPMDMIKSGLDASPWGLNGYGFDSYAGDSPGNAVLALARYWLDNASQIAAAEKRYPDQCHRIRYEDMVTATEDVASEIFAFLGLPAVPQIEERCFSADREWFGPADHKIWATSRISDKSVGKGESIPSGLIPAPILGGINELAGQLGYQPVDDTWGTPGRDADPRVPGSSPFFPDVPSAAEAPVGPESLLPVERAIEKLLWAGLARIDDEFRRRWDICSADCFLVVSHRDTGREAGSEANWLVNLTSRTVTLSEDEAEESQWNVLGSPDAWRSVLNGDLNFYVALRRNEIRYCDSGDVGPFGAQVRTAMLVDLLGMSALAPAVTALVSDSDGDGDSPV